MLNRYVLTGAILFSFIVQTPLAEARKGGASRTPASLEGCQISRKGTKIRCPNGMFIRQDVVDRKIASEKSGKSSKKKKKKSDSSKR